MRVAALLAVCLFALRCSPAGNAAREAAPLDPRAAPPDFVGKVWISPDASAPRGTMRIFLPDGTLVMDSCWETYRLAQWEMVGDRRIAWTEDTARIEADIERPGADRLALRLRLAGRPGGNEPDRSETYRLAAVPFVCPDMPR